MFDGQTEEPLKHRKGYFVGQQIDIHEHTKFIF